jgi:BirA family biotin operon repressor/biotin-[acetyl-CoA-carboxylase] ligase
MIRPLKSTDTGLSWLGQTEYLFDSIESTQHKAHQLAKAGAPSGTLIRALTQTAGRGRYGRKWHSKAGEGICLSFLVRPDLTITEVPQLTLLTAVAVLKGLLAQAPLHYQIKWPNDILIGKKKIAGILTEMNLHQHLLDYVVIGIGVNVNQEKAAFPEELKQIASSVRIESGLSVDINQLTISILQAWEHWYHLYQAHGFLPIKHVWEAHAISIGTRMLVRQSHKAIEGICQGITNEGALLLEDGYGTVHQIYSSEIETFS